MAATTTVWRLRVVTACLLLSALCFRQAPGLVAPDTKLDLTADPGGLLERGFTIWNDAALGQLQNQAYGYLFPIGPFHWALDGVGVPAWVVQRLWWSLVLAVAFVGFWRLAGALRLGTPWGRYAAALLFAVSPRFLAEVTVTSIEVWPMAVAPWVLLPLVDPSPRRPWVRAIRSAAAYGCIGGVNAVATGAALVLPTLWFVTRAPWRLALRQLAGWLAAVTAASLWWLLPLFVLGRYSPPFLDWIEDARVTTSTASPVNALQGTSAWLGFLSDGDGPSWPAAWSMITQPVLIVLTLTVAVLGLVGLAHRGMPQRRWLSLSLVVGLALLTVGFWGGVGGIFAEQVHTVLDGVLAPLRNTHKFELVVRIPLLLGVAHAIGLLARRQVLRRLPREVVAAVAAMLVVAVAGPLVAAALPRAGSYAALPAFWRDCATWLDSQEGPGSVLVVPGAAFADFTWGSTKDEPLQALMRRPFAVRDAVPLGGAGTTRLLDEVERRLSSGRGSAPLRRVLNEAGIRYVVVRNDLLLSSGAAQPVPVHEALDESGLTRVATFGPPARGGADAFGRTLNERTLLPYPSVEIYDTGPTVDARLVPHDLLRSVTGGSEDLVDLAALVPPGGAALLGSDRERLGDQDVAGEEIVTDGLRRREVAFGRPNDNTSTVLPEDDPGRSSRRTIDYISDASAGQTTLSWRGVSAVRTSSSASDSTATLRLGVGYGPAAALDGDVGTRWVSGNYLTAVGEWFEVELAEPRDVSGLAVLLSGLSPIEALPTRLSVETAGGSASTVVARPDEPVALDVPPGLTRRVRIRVEAVDAKGENGFSLAEVRIPGVTALPVLDVLAARDGQPGVVMARVQNPGNPGCYYVSERSLCAAEFVRAAEEPQGLLRAFSTRAAATYRWSGTVLPHDGPALERLLASPRQATVTTSSQRVPAVAARGATVLDRDLGTGWVAAPLDIFPTLTVSLPQARTITGLQFLVDTYLAGSRPTTVAVRGSDGSSVAGKVDPQGYVRFPPMTVTGIEVRFLADDRSTSVDAATGLVTRLPVGVSELRLEGADDMRRTVDLDQRVAVPCGFGPTVTVDDTSWTTSVRGTVGQVLRHEPMIWEACGTGSDVAAAVSAGRHWLTAPSTVQFRPYELTLAMGSSEPASGSSSVALASEGGAWPLPTRQEAALLVVPHNFNQGWSARDGLGMTLAAVRVNGWQQGWVVPAGDATVVEATFGPQRAYVAGMGLGAASLMGVFVLALSTMRRGRQRRMPAEPAAPLVVTSRSGWLVVSAWALMLCASGPVGVLALAVAAAVALASRRVRYLPAAAVAGLGAVAAVLVAREPWGSGGAALLSTTPQVAVVAAFSVVVFVGWSLTVEDRSPRRPQRMSGRSMKR